MSHTPGPWVWRWKSGELCTVGKPPYPFGKSVLFPDDNQSVIVSDDDAALIAAAPDLLEVAQYFTSPLPDSTIDFYGWFARGTELARQAISKAEGDKPCGPS